MSSVVANHAALPISSAVGARGLIHGRSSKVLADPRVSCPMGEAVGLRNGIAQCTALSCRAL